MDVDKDFLHYYIRSRHTATPLAAGQVPNTAEGIATLKKILQQTQTLVIVLEATGIYHELLLNTLKTETVLWVVNPAHIKITTRIKTDDRDAQHLAELVFLGIIGGHPTASVKPRVYGPTTRCQQVAHLIATAITGTSSPQPQTTAYTVTADDEALLRAQAPHTILSRRQLQVLVRLYDRLRRQEIVAQQNIRRTLHRLAGAKPSLLADKLSYTLLWLLFGLLQENWTYDDVVTFLTLLTGKKAEISAATSSAAAAADDAPGEITPFSQVLGADVKEQELQVVDVKQRRVLGRVRAELQKKRGQYRRWYAVVQRGLRQHPELRYELETWFLQLQVVRQHKEQVFRELERQVAEHKVLQQEVAVLLSVPGVGFLTAVTFAVEVGPVRRFSGAKQVAKYVGLTPYVRQSGGKTRLGPVTKQGSRYVRAQLGMVVVNMLRIKEHPIGRFYMRLRRRNKPHRVALTAAMRKVVVLLYHLLRKNEPFKARHVRGKKTKKAVVSAARLPTKLLVRTLRLLRPLSVMDPLLWPWLVTQQSAADSSCKKSTGHFVENPP